MGNLLRLLKLAVKYSAYVTVFVSTITFLIDELEKNGLIKNEKNG